MKFLPVIFTLTAALAAAQSTHAQTQAPAPDFRDERLGPLKDLDGYFPWSPVAAPDSWANRAGEVRKQMQVSLGLHPWPTKTPLSAVIHGKIEGDDYTVEKAYFESMPGFFVTGSLYRPKGQKGPFPAVLCPHGHWPDGRLGFVSDAELKKEISSGGERFERGGHSLFQSLGVQLARMGCVAFIVDMIGYADSQQLSFDLGHKFAKQRPEMISPEAGKWGLYSPQGESQAQSIMGLQTWGNIRALDFLTSLPDVDGKRIGCTGGSGGGTQTMILGALDPRVTVAVPAVMVSTAMQGGCTCENACGLRIGTGNIEFAALFAPKPMAMTSAKDWTLEMPTKGYPDLQKHWAMLGEPENVHLFHHPEFGHNYNIITREHIYAWFNRHFALNLPPERLKERDYELLSKEQLTVWDKDHPSPPGGPELEKKLLRWWYEDAKSQIEKDIPTFRNTAEPALHAVLRTQNPAAVRVEKSNTTLATAGGKPVNVSNIKLRSKEGSTEVTGTLLQAGKQASPRVAVIIAKNGANSIAADGKQHPVVSSLLDAGIDVFAVNLLQQNQDGYDADTPTRRVNNPREAAAYTLGYNDPLIVQRAQDIRSAVANLPEIAPYKQKVLVALDSYTAPIAALGAASLPAPTLDALIIDTGGFRFQNVTDIRDPRFLPILPKYADLPGLLALNAPRKIFVMGEGSALPGIANAAYESAAVPDTVRVSEKTDWNAAISWFKDRLQ